MLVAIDDDTEMVLGFVDIDARPCKTKRKLPRPYLSDLCIHEDFRRRGIANRLVKACEEFTRKIPRPELWIRVKDDNIAAVQMYKKLDYSIIGTDDEENDIIILHKKFEEASNPNEELNSASSDT
jgi:ribosomal protein S18 acetylase RimI-like enzyme